MLFRSVSQSRYTVISTGRIVNSSAKRADGTIDETKVTMNIDLDDGSLWIL